MGLLILVEVLLFYKLRFKVDMTGIILLALNLFVAILRVIQSEIPDGDGGQPLRVLKISSQLFISFSLYYFTFDMQTIN